ncbi:MAG TPA: phosphoribosylglycinamide formyltransferase [Cyclobacteriaceae bacterium]|nr:phosphoribosylglycinamide formyltransferase [Cyclobacteriaceae bacterium]
MSKTYRLAIFASGSGTNAEEIMKFFKDHPAIEVSLLLSNSPDAYALERASIHKVESKVFDRKQFRQTDEVVNWLKEKKITHVVLAGFLWLIPENLLKAFPRNIVNIHPALLPKYGGKGMYGMNVHEAVKASGDLQTGITIHLVNDQYDDGEILAQKIVEIEAGDTAADIAQKVHKLEYNFYPTVIEAWVKAQQADLKLGSPGPHRKGSDSLKLWGDGAE